MRKISLGLVLGALGFSNTLKVNPKEDGASILINWSNNKGEKKMFKIDDVEKELGNEKIHSKTLLQKYYRTSKPSCSYSKSCGKRSDSFGERSCSYGRSYSKKKHSFSGCKPCRVKKYRKPIIIEHRPIYKKNIIYRPRKKQNKFHVNDYYNRNQDKCNSLEKCYDKNYDKTKNKLTLEELAKLYKLKNDAESNQKINRRSVSKLRKNKNISKYLKDNDSKYLKNNAERSCSNDYRVNHKEARVDRDTKQKNKDLERDHEKECRDSHNVVNLADKKNEALLMKEKDKDNLHSNDRVIEEFDKLEHFKKVEERCRSASKARHANVKKNDCLDKAQKADAANFNKECRSNKKLRSNKNNECNDFDITDKSCLNKDSKYLKDEKECDFDSNNERELECKDNKETCSLDNYKNSKDSKDKCDYENKKCKNDKFKKNVDVNDNEKYYKNKNGRYQNKEKGIDEFDKMWNDKDCNIC